MTDDDVRVRADERRRLMGELELERNQLIRNVETCRLRDITSPFIGAWSVLDIMEHVAKSDAAVAQALRDYRGGSATAVPEFGCDRTPEGDEADLSQLWPMLERLRQERDALLAQAAQFSDEEITATGSLPMNLVIAAKEHDKVHWHDIAAKLAGMSGARRQAGLTTES